METITLLRLRADDKATIGLMKVGSIIVATLEDPVREKKIFGDTAIPVGRYDLLLRNEGGKTLRYAERFPEMHKGMIWLQNVKNFTYVYIHIGNYPKDTLGCILVGERAKQSSLESSTSAYKRIYPVIVEMIQDKGCQLIIKDDTNVENDDG